MVRDHPVGGGNIWVNKILFQEESESEELVSYLLKKYIEYEVLSVAVGCMKRFDENVMEEQDALYTCFQLVESVMEGSDDPNIATKVCFQYQDYADRKGPSFTKPNLGWIERKLFDVFIKTTERTTNQFYQNIRWRNFIRYSSKFRKFY